ncbi:MAG: thrombospondin type 3 repeat-containing protein, partial [Duncaniella sp.]|nr:thrombospondin type 3 repeat-containing protein [Duncaniella sp.]
VMAYAGASLWRDAVDARFMEECRTGTATYTGEKSNRPGIVDFINDPEGEQNPIRPSYPELVSETRPAGYDTDGDGMPDAWEIANGLDPSDAKDGQKITLDPTGGYTTVEVYINSILEHIMKGGNADAIDPVDEYYPTVDMSGIEDIIVPGASDIESIEYYDLRGIRLSEPAKGINIRRTVYADGTTSTDKIVK